MVTSRPLGAIISFTSARSSQRFWTRTVAACQPLERGSTVRVISATGLVALSLSCRSRQAHQNATIPGKATAIAQAKLNHPTHCGIAPSPKNRRHISMTPPGMEALMELSPAEPRPPP